jgi:hypothetical protein
LQDGSVQSQIVEAADGKLDTSGEFARCHALPKADSLSGADPIDGFGTKLRVVFDEALIEVARLKLVFRQQLFGLRRLLDAFEEVAKTCADLCGQDVGKSCAGLFLLEASRGLGLVSQFVQLFDDRPKQGFLARVVVIEGLPR